MLETVRDERQMKAMTGVSQEKFAELLPVFSRVYQQAQHQAYEAGVAKGTRQRKVGGGQKGKLPKMADKLFFILTYYKTYPTFDVLSHRFGLARSKAPAHVHQLSPILQQTLQDLGHLPHRAFESVEAFKAALGDVEQILIDVTERPHHRPQDDEPQRELYSGKKTTHGPKLDHCDPGQGHSLCRSHLWGAQT
ncbi:MAG: transposase family protein [Okeania sp. SIO3B3]|nr:transposase family protein [Okeania sp. SIO3B3]